MKGITWLELGEPSKDDIKCTLQADHRNVLTATAPAQTGPS